MSTCRASGARLEGPPAEQVLEKLVPLRVKPSARIHSEANYAHYGKLPTDILYCGHNGAGNEYGSGVVAGDGELSGQRVTVHYLRIIDDEFVLSGQMGSEVFAGTWQRHVEGRTETGSFMARRIRP